MTLAILGTGGHAKSVYDIIKNRKKIDFFDKKSKLFEVEKKKFNVKADNLLINNNKKKNKKVIVEKRNN